MTEACEAPAQAPSLEAGPLLWEPVNFDLSDVAWNDLNERLTALDDLSSAAKIATMEYHRTLRQILDEISARVELLDRHVTHEHRGDLKSIRHLMEKMRMTACGHLKAAN